MTAQDITLSPQIRKTWSALQIEDIAGKFLLLMFFLWCASTTAISVTALILQPQHDMRWALDLFSQICSLAFVGLIVSLTVTRKPPIDVQPGLEARISSFAGTFILLALIAVPRAEVGETQALIATIMIIVGTLSSIWCLWWLGRAFAVMAAARDLVTSGPYAHVRHPLYTAEAILVAGVIMFNGSLYALGVGLLQFVFQYRRMLNEEAVLARAFPRYAAYKATTPMVLPRLI